MPPPIGVVNGPLMPIRWVRNVSTVSSGSQLPVSSNAFCPARTSFHATLLPRLAAAASSTDLAAGQMSTPMPSPSMKGMTGSSGTCSAPSAPREMSSAIEGAYRLIMERSPPERPGPGSESVSNRRPANSSSALGGAQAQRTVDLTGRARPVERIEVKPGHPGIEQFPAQFGGNHHPFAAHGIGTTGSVGILQTLHHPGGHGRTHGGHAGNRLEVGHRHDAREHRRLHATGGKVGHQSEVLLGLEKELGHAEVGHAQFLGQSIACLLYTSDAADDLTRVEL